MEKSSSARMVYSRIKMPTYIFHDIETDEYFESVMKISEMEEFLSENSHVKQVIMAPAIVSQAPGDLYSKTPSGFKDVIAKVAEKHPQSTLAQRYGKKSIKDVRNERVVNEHVKRITDKLANN